MGAHGEDDFCSTEFSTAEIHSLWIANLVASLLSVIGSSFMLLNFFLYDKNKNPLSKLVAWLAFGDYVTAIGNIIKSLILLKFHDWWTWDVCVIMRAWFQIAAGSTWCYTSVIAFFLWRHLHTKDTGRHSPLLPQSSSCKSNFNQSFCQRLHKCLPSSFHLPAISWPLWATFHIFSWGVPLAGVIIMVSGNFIYQSTTTQHCYPTEPWHVILWYSAVTCLYIIYTQSIKHSQNNNNNQQVRPYNDEFPLDALLLYSYLHQDLQHEEQARHGARPAQPSAAKLVHPLQLLYSGVLPLLVL